MRVRRRLGTLTVTALGLVFLSSAAPATAADEACAQRVIRDWYSGGRVDGVYPLRCYRAAIRSLPSDVLQYSDADQDIRRALVFARRGRPDPGDGAAATAAAATPKAAGGSTTAAPPSPAPAPAAKPESTPKQAEDQVAAPPAQAALAPASTASSSSLPLPVLALAGLAGVLLATGAASWLVRRR